MPGRPKSQWKQKHDELKAQLPKGFDARLFRGARRGGKLDKDEAAEVIAAKKWSDKQDAIYSFLTHLESKPAGKKRGAKKQKVANQEPSKVNLLAKRTYSDLSATDMAKLIEMLAGIQKDRKEAEIAGLKAKKEEIDMKLKELQGK